jgi:hypothetical protein
MSETIVVYKETQGETIKIYEKTDIRVLSQEFKSIRIYTKDETRLQVRKESPITIKIYDKPSVVMGSGGAPSNSYFPAGW